MSTLAIIAEYNPYTKGHAYLLSEAKRRTNADTTIAVMGGNFLQRGQAALWNKYLRAKAAVSCGLSCCFELPFPYATGSSGDFAKGAVSMLDAFCSVDYLCFGAEAEEPGLLFSISEVIAGEPEENKRVLKEQLKKGFSYPVARENALLYFMGDVAPDTLRTVLQAPNNILAIEYLAALFLLKSSIKPVIIRREASDYKSTELSTAFPCASALRKCYASSGSIDVLKNHLPEGCFSALREADKRSAPVFTEALTPFL